MKKDHPSSRPLIFFDNYDLAPSPTGPGVGLYSGNMGKYKSVSQFLKSKKRDKKIKAFATVFKEAVTR